MSFHGDDSRLAPSRRTRDRRPVVAPAMPEADESDIARGMEAAILGALARVQLRVDVLAREQADMFLRLSVAIDQIQATLQAQGGDAPRPEAYADELGTFPQAASGERRRWS